MSQVLLQPFFLLFFYVDSLVPSLSFRFIHYAMSTFTVDLDVLECSSSLSLVTQYNLG